MRARNDKGERRKVEEEKRRSNYERKEIRKNNRHEKQD